MGRVLVTGGAGFIGSHTVDRLIELGYDVAVMDAFFPPVHSRPCDYLNSKAEYVFWGDVTDRRSWEMALDGVDAIFHLAAYQDYQPNFSHFFYTNTVSTALLYEEIVRRKLPVKKVVVASSQAVYGEGTYFCREHGRVFPPPRSEAQLKLASWGCVCPRCLGKLSYARTGEDVVNPHNSYSLSKYQQEQVGLMLGQRYGIPTTALRYSIVQGPRQSIHNAYSGVLRRFTLQLLNEEPATIYEDGQQVRDYIGVQDVVDANLLALEDSRTDFEVYNVGGDREITVREYLKRLADRLGKEPRWIFGGYRFGDTRHVVSDVSKLKQLGWGPKVTLDEILTGYLEWMRSQPYPQTGTGLADLTMQATGVVREVA